MTRSPGKSIQKDKRRGRQSLWAVGTRSGAASSGSTWWITHAGPNRLLERRGSDQLTPACSSDTQLWAEAECGGEQSSFLAYVLFPLPILHSSSQMSSVSWPAAGGGGRAREGFAVVVCEGFWCGKGGADGYSGGRRPGAGI